MKYINLSNNQPVENETLMVGGDVERIIFDASNLYNRAKNETRRLFSKIEVNKNNKKFDTTKDLNAIIDNGTLVLGTENTKIPEGVTELGQGAFAGILNPFSLTLPKTVLSIQAKAISDCAIEEFISNDGLLDIRAYAFYNCPNIKKIFLSKTVSSVKNINEWDANLLQVLEIDKDNEFYSYDGKLLIDKKTKTLLNVNEKALENCGEFKIEGIYEIEKDAFASKFEGVNKLVFSKDLMVINTEAFYGCDIEKIVLEGETISIKKNAFNRTKIKKVVAPLISLDSILDKDAKLLFFAGFVEAYFEGAFNKDVKASYDEFAKTNKKLILSKYPNDELIKKYIEK